MYSLLSGFWNLFFSKPQYQLLILGLDDAGKTSVLEQLRHRYSGSSDPRAMKIPPTVGLNIGKFEIDNSKFLIWDLGGQTSLRVLWDKYFSDSHAIIFVVDSTDASRGEENYKEIEKILTDKQLSDAPVIIMANKADLKERAESVETISSRLNFEGIADNTGGLTVTNFSAAAAAGGASAKLAALELAGQRMTDGRAIRFQSVSALTGVGITEAMEWIMRTLPKCKRTEDLAERL